MTTKQGILIGCGVAFVLGVLLVALVIALFVHMAKDVEGVLVKVDIPMDVSVGETFDLVVNVHNERTGRDLALSDIDISENFLSGFTVVSTDPEAKSTTHVPIVEKRGFTFEVRIPAGESRPFSFRLRAEKEGIYRGDVDLYEASRSITTMVQTVVRPKE
jgi:hypothetical protein